MVCLMRGEQRDEELRLATHAGTEEIGFLRILD